MSYKKNSPWIDITLRLNPEIEKSLSVMAQEIDESVKGSGRRDALRNIMTALSIVCANLLKMYFIGNDLNVALKRSNESYPKGLYNPHGMSAMSLRKVINYLKGSDPVYVKVYGGNNDRVKKRSYPSQLMYSDSFINLLLNILVDTIGYAYPSHPSPITRKTLDYDYYCLNYQKIFRVSELPSIRLRKPKSEGKLFIGFDETDETQRMRSSLSCFNEFIESKSLDLLIPDNEFFEINVKDLDVVDEYVDESDNKSPVDLVAGHRLYRVFNDSRFDHGGRFYGGWWQDIPSDYRRFITINGLPTVELDFSGMQLAMLYAKAGLELEGDAYAIAGINPSHRGLIKTMTLKLINATGGIETPPTSELPDGMVWKDFQEAIFRRHVPIEKYFGSGEGIRLQRLDSDIAERIMMEMLGMGIVALPVHDSFIVQEGHQDTLRDVMLTAYEKVMGGRTIKLKQAPSLFDELLADQVDLSAIERHRMGLERFHDRKQGDEYQGYRMREEWASGTASNGDAALRDMNQIISPRPLGRLNLRGPRAWFKNLAISWAS